MSDAKRIKELRDLLTRANRAYYTDADPIMSDREFDALLDELATLEHNHPDLADPNSPTVRVGGQPIAGFETKKHAVPMLSIDNTYNEQEVREWVSRVRSRLDHYDDKYVRDSVRADLAHDPESYRFDSLMMRKTSWEHYRFPLHSAAIPLLVCIRPYSSANPKSTASP
ncbi:MAG: hypothetical protein R3B67_00510 [Phycisphaerales bacterium]